jgi:hypothetical protein
MTVVTIKCGKCGSELVSLEQDGISILELDPCPTCLIRAYDAGADDADSEWETCDDWDEEEDDDDYVLGDEEDDEEDL